MWLSSGFLYAQFSIGPGGWVTVQEGGTLMIGTDLHIKSVAGASGYLVDQTVDGDITITGDIDVDRYLTADMWHNVGVPVSDETTACYSGTDLIFYYDETLILNDWNFGWVMMYPSSLVPFKGYDVYFFDNPVTITYSATGAETINTGSYSMGVTITTSVPGEIPTHLGWNLLGNPYPSPVDWLAASGWDKSDINDAKYIWDGTNDIYTIYIGGGAPIGINGGTRFIPSNQGFWVQAVANGNVGINNATRVGNITGTPDFYKEDSVDYPMVSLISSNETYHDEIIIRFIEGTSQGFDVNWDAMKLFSMNPDVPQLSIKSGNQSFALNTLPLILPDLEVNLNFQCAKPGFYSVTLTDRTKLDNETELYLKDLIENKIINLKEERVYRFSHQPANSRERFRLYFNPSEDVINNISPETWFSVYSHEHTLTVLKNTVKEISGSLCVFDMLGRPVMKVPLTNDKTMTFNLITPTGYYIVSILTDDHISNFKILITQ